MKNFLRDPRNPFAVLLILYAVLGCTVWGFNRSPSQILLTIAIGCGLEMFLAWMFREKHRLIPKSALITSISLSLLLNYGHSYLLVVFPVFCAIASKYLITWRGRHVFNPSLFGVVIALFLGNAQYAAAPAYQWGNSIGLPAFMITAACVFFLFKVNRLPLVIAFLIFYLTATLARAWVTRYHLPPETLLAGTFSAPSLYLFTFFMITDPRTSPSGTRGQILWALGIVLLDLWLHFSRSLSTLFISLFLLSAARWLYLHLRDLLGNQQITVRKRELLKRWAMIGLIFVSGKWAGAEITRKTMTDPAFVFKEHPGKFPGELGTLLEEVDPRVVHISKWLFSVGDAVAVGDFDNDGLQDLFLTNPLKRPEHRNALFRNRGNLDFERIAIPCLDEISRSPKKFGISTGALFLDYDNDGDEDLFLNTAYGPCRLLENNSGEFQILSNPGFPEWSISVAATGLDIENDGLLDLYICEAMSPRLLAYPRKDRPLFNIFELPEPAYEGDERMFRFMHEGWHDAKNGGNNHVMRNRNGSFFPQPHPETRISLAVSTSDFNDDGFTDLYVANDFGPDDVYINEVGTSWKKLTGRGFGSIGRDTYKGMNVSIGPIQNQPDRKSVYVSNVHAPLQAEGSLLWEIDSSLRARDVAAVRGALNESGFGWGAALGDLNRDGWLDIVQANGMVDDSPDRRFEEPRDYWYEASQIMLSGPEIHGAANRWADIRGFEIFGRQQNKVYLSNGKGSFVQVNDQVGLTEKGNSRGMALADFDNDGDLDLVITHQFAAAQLFENQSGNEHCWIGLDIEGDGGNVTRDAVGTKVSVNGSQFREVRITNGFSAQNDKRLFFGLGENRERVDVVVKWPDGTSSNYTNLAPSQYHKLTY